MLRIGIDLGGTKIEGVVLDPDARERLRVRIPTERERGYEHILGRIAALYDRLRTESGNAPHTLGIGTPGALSRRTGVLRNSNTTALNGRPLRDDLEARLGHAVTLENDANCFALAEARLGAGRGHRIVFGVILGTGCGGGIIIDGALHVGRQSIAGEWGHMSIDPHGPVCYCGQRGCVETFISGSGLEARFFERSGLRLDAERIVLASRAGDPIARAVLDDYFVHFGRALANVIDVLDPDVVVLGGGLSKIDELYRDGVHAISERVFSDALDTPIRRHQLGDSAGVIGAALLRA